MQRLNSLKDWGSVKEGEVFTLPRSGGRTVRIHINAPGSTLLQIRKVEKEAKPQFLALVEGLDTLEFQCEGPHEVMADGYIQFRTSEGQQVARDNPGKKTYARLDGFRRERNKELEEMFYRSQLNSQNMMQQLLGEQQAQHEAQMEALKADVDDKRKSNPEPAKEEPKSDPDKGPSGDNPGDPPKGDDLSGGGGD